MSENQEIGQQQTTTTAVDKEGLDFVEIAQRCLAIFLGNWRWFALSVVVCLAVAWLYLKCQPRLYYSSETILVENNDANKNQFSSSLNALKQLNGVQVADNLTQEVFILHSRRLMAVVAERLNLNVFYKSKNGLTPVDYYLDGPFTATFNEEYQAPVSFSAQVINGSSIVISDFKIGGRETDFTGKVNYGTTVKTPAGLITFVKGQSEQDFTGKTIRVSRINPMGATKMFLGRTAVAQIDKESNLIGLSCRDTNKGRAQAVLTEFVTVYKEDIVQSKNAIAENTAKFIDNRINLIGSELSDVENRLAQYKQSNNIVDFSMNAQNYLQQTTTNQALVTELQTQLSVANYLKDYVSNNANSHNLIPDLSGLGNSGLQTQISQYNTTLLNYNRLAQNSTADSPVIQEQERALSSVMATIKASLDNYVNSLKLRINQAQATTAQVRSSMSGIPQKEIQALDITRQQTIKEALYTYLLNKREEVALQLAISEANIRIIEYPYGPGDPVSPHHRQVYLIAFIIGLIIPSLVLFVLIQINHQVRSRRDVEDALTAPIIGELPLWIDDKRGDKVLTKADNNKGISEAFRILRYSLDFVAKKGGVFMVTSSTAHQGKTFVSRNLAFIIGLAGRKVILVDADIRKRMLTHAITTSHTAGLTGYLAGNETDLDSLIIKNVDENVDLLPAGMVPPNPSELLMREELDQLAAELRKRYDYVIVDSTPAVTTADAGIVNRIVDVTLYVIRLGVEDRRFLRQLDKIYRSGRFKQMNVILNGSANSANSYGYGYGGYGGYGYGYGGYGYGYGYGYGTDEKKKKRRGKMIKHKTDTPTDEEV